MKNKAPTLHHLEECQLSPYFQFSVKKRKTISFRINQIQLHHINIRLPEQLNRKKFKENQLKSKVLGTYENMYQIASSNDKSETPTL